MKHAFEIETSIATDEDGFVETRWQARCSCGWSQPQPNRKERQARLAGSRHRAGAYLQEQTRLAEQRYRAEKAQQASIAP